MDSEEFYDERSQEQKNQDAEKVAKLTAANYQRFNLKTHRVVSTGNKNPNSPKPSSIVDLNFEQLYIKMREEEQNLQKHKLQRALFEDGMYCYYTDSDKQTEGMGGAKRDNIFALPVVTVSGMPSFTHEWQRLESACRCRWINFIVPGFDGEDERRGEYHKNTRFGNSQALQAAEVLIRLLDKLKIGRFVLCVHSFGVSILAAVVEVLQQQRIAAIAFWGTTGLNPSVGALVGKAVFEAFFGQQQLRLSENQYKLLATDDSLRQRLVQETRTLWPYLSETEIVTWAKFLLSPHFGLQEFLRQHKRGYKPYLKFIAAGKKDLIIDSSVHERTIVHHTDTLHRFSGELKPYQKEYLKQKFQSLLSNCTLDFERLQDNFVFLCEDAGHPVHLQKGQDLAHAFEVYLAVVEALTVTEAARL